MGTKKKILVAPLDWGLGHATRCIPVIELLLKKGAEVFIGGSGLSGALLKKEFPQLLYQEIPGYDISYSENLSMVASMLRQAPGILSAIRKEKSWLEDFIGRRQPDAVISDHRYGLYNKKTHCIFMGHQLFISSPLMENILWRVNKSYIENFDECWVPDLPGENNASGKLAHKEPLPFPHTFTGILSRLKPVKKMSPATYKACFILSGPEPLRTTLENIIFDQVSQDSEHAYHIIRGTDQRLRKDPPGNATIKNLCTTAEIEEVAAQSEILVTRSGYSSIMDHIISGNQAMLVPTPGQTEQEYLARYHLDQGNFYSVSQENIDLVQDLRIAMTYKTEIKNDEDLLEAAVDALLGRDDGGLKG